MPALKTPFVGPAPIVNSPPAANEWGQITRPIIDSPISIEGTVGGTPITIEGVAGGTPIAIAETFPTTTDVQVIPAAIVLTVLATANPNRRGLTIYNDSNRTLYVKLGANASLISWTTKLFQDDLYELPSPVYVGDVTCIWAAGIGGNAVVTETRL